MRAPSLHRIPRSEPYLLRVGRVGTKPNLARPKSRGTLIRCLGSGLGEATRLHTEQALSAGQLQLLQPGAWGHPP